MIETQNPDSRLAHLSAEAQERFLEDFGKPAPLVVAAPGRVNLIGEHVDYNDGLVLPLAIDRRVVIAGRRISGPEAVLTSGLEDGRVTFRMDRAQAVGEPAWANYVRGVIAGFQERGIAVPAFEASAVTDLPPGAGLSSSAALEVAAATFFEILAGQTLDPAEKARLCQQAEHRFAGVPCGLMDQFASVFGRVDHALLLDCRNDTIQKFALLDPAIAIVVANTGVKHALADGEYARRRQECDEALGLLGASSWRDVVAEDLAPLRGHLLRRGRHVVGEIARAGATAEALERGDWQQVGELMAASHRSLRDDYEVSCVELDLMVALAEGQPGVIGSRMTGGGFGGATVTLVKREEAEPLTERMRRVYRNETGIDAAIFPVRAAAGAGVVQNLEAEA